MVLPVPEVVPLALARSQQHGSTTFTPAVGSGFSLVYACTTSAMMANGERGCLEPERDTSGGLMPQRCGKESERRVGRRFRMCHLRARGSSSARARVKVIASGRDWRLAVMGVVVGFFLCCCCCLFRVVGGGFATKPRNPNPEPPVLAERTGRFASVASLTLVALGLLFVPRSIVRDRVLTFLRGVFLFVAAAFPALCSRVLPSSWPPYLLCVRARVCVFYQEPSFALTGRILAGFPQVLVGS